MDAGKPSELEPALDFALIVDIDNNHCWSRINVLTDALRSHAEYLQKSMVDSVRNGDLDYAAVNFAEYKECSEMLYVIQQELTTIAMNNFRAPASANKGYSPEQIAKERADVRADFLRHFNIL